MKSSEIEKTAAPFNGAGGGGFRKYRWFQYNMRWKRTQVW